MYRYSVYYVTTFRVSLLRFLFENLALLSLLLFRFSCLLSLVSCLLSLDTLGRHLLNNTFLTFFSTSVCKSSGVCVCVCVYFLLTDK